ncbi:MAG TPA: ATPase [Bacteroidales bacterium]|nr:ATPase [Bacteroidales bacterium]
MKTIRVVLTAVIMAAFNVAGSAQSHDHSKASDAQDSIKTESFKVWGECGMCKARIEKTVMAEGATDASWDSKTKLLTVRYNPAKTGKEALCKKLAAAGHDTEKFTAPDNIYNSLPGCCHYERQK